MKNTVTLFALALIFCTIKAHAQNYSFELDQSYYEELDNSRTTYVNTFDSSTHLGLAFTNGSYMNLFGKRFNFTRVTPLVVLGDGAVSGFEFDDTTAFFIFGLQSRIRSKQTGSEISMLIEGVPGTGIYKIEYRNVGFKDAPDSIFANFQIWMYQENQNIEIHIGPNNLNESVGEVRIGVWHTDLTPGPSPDGAADVYEVIQLAGSAAKPDVIRNEGDISLRTYPTDGQVFRFVYNQTAGIDLSYTKPSINLYPNPANNMFQVKKAAGINITYYEMLTLSGKVEQSGDFNNQGIFIDDLKNGMYFIRLHSTEGVATKPFIKN